MGKARTAPAEGTDGSTLHHLGFAVKDLAAVKGKLDALHVESASVNGNAKQIMAKFPEKVTVELTEDPAIPTAVAMHHIHLATPDPEKQRAWYVKTFGARPGTRGSFLAAFIPGGEVDTRKVQDPQAPSKGRSLDHIGFEVRNLDVLQAALGGRRAVRVPLPRCAGHWPEDRLPLRPGRHTHRAHRGIGGKVAAPCLLRDHRP